MRHIRTLYIFLVFILLSSPPFLHAATEQRTALVIGNSAYESGRLKNPTNDATDIAAALQKAGFTVILKKNASLKEMDDAIDNFGNRLKRGGVGLFYFAGHGVQVNGINYLIPIGGKINKESDVKYEAVDANRVLDEMANANNGLNIVMLDACRDNPYARRFRNAARGLAIVSTAPTGTFISYSTAPGQVAIDGEGRNSPYTRALLKYMQEPGIPITELFIKVRQKLRKETGQVPWELSSIEGAFYFVPGKSGKSTEAVREEAAAPTAELDDEQRKIDAEREKLRKEKELLEQKEALAREKRELAEREKQLAIGARSSASMDELDDKIRNTELAQRELEKMKPGPGLDPQLLEAMRIKLKAERNRLEEEKKQLAMGARPSASTGELDDKIRNLEMMERELERQRPRLDPNLVDSTQKKLKAERNRLEEEKKQLAMGASPSVSTANEIKRDGRFIAYDDGTVLDTRTNLMWAAQDNGSDFTWQDATSYCQNYRGGGYTDWRMPKQNELAGLYDGGKQNRLGARLTDLIQITNTPGWIWAAESQGAFAYAFNFDEGRVGSGIPQSYGHYRALPVRSSK